MYIEVPRNQLDRRYISMALCAFRPDDFLVRLPMQVKGIDADTVKTFNEILELKKYLAKDFERPPRMVARMVAPASAGRGMGRQDVGGPAFVRSTISSKTSCSLRRRWRASSAR